MWGQEAAQSVNLQGGLAQTELPSAGPGSPFHMCELPPEVRMTVPRPEFSHGPYNKETSEIASTSCTFYPSVTRHSAESVPCFILLFVYWIQLVV